MLKTVLKILAGWFLVIIFLFFFMLLFSDV